MKALPLFALALSCAAPAVASVTVNKPASGSTVTSPFSLLASASPCLSEPIAAMGYSFDSSPNNTIIAGATLSASITAPLGTHTLHVKSWGKGNTSCVVNLVLNVVQGSTSNTTDISIAAPVNGATVSSPFALSAGGTLCNGQAIVSMGYSLDLGSTTTKNGQSITGNVTATSGSHTLHVKAWSKGGAGCASDVAISIKAASSGGTSGPTIPATALVTNLIQNLTTWTAEHDAGTTGGSSGSTSLVASPSMSGSARQFDFSYSSYGGERFNIKVPTDQASTNFVYDTQIYVASPTTDIANIEMDLNQVMTNGETVIFGFQCDGWSKTWDYTANMGTPASPVDHWLHSTQTCNPQAWTPNAWHHIQVQYSRDDSGNVTYKTVWLDGVEQDLNVTVMSAFALHWGPSLNINLQLDGATSTSGAGTLYLDKLTLYHW